MPQLRPTQPVDQESSQTKSVPDTTVINDITISGNRGWIATNKPTIREIDLSLSPKQKGQSWDGHTKAVNSMSLVVPTAGEDTEHLISGSSDNDIRVWNTNASSVRTPSGHHDGIRDLAVIPSQPLPLPLLATSGLSPMIQLWELSNLSVELIHRAESGAIEERVGMANRVVYVSHSRGINIFTGHYPPQSPSDSLSCPPSQSESTTTGKFVWWWQYDQRSHAKQELEAKAKAPSVINPMRGYNYHGGAINDMICVSGQPWTASADETVKVLWNPCIMDANPQCSTLAHNEAVQTLIHTSQFKPWAEAHPSEKYVISGAGKYLYIWNVSSLNPTTPDVDSNTLVGRYSYADNVTVVRFWRMDEGSNVPIIIISQGNSWVTRTLTELIPKTESIGGNVIVDNNTSEAAEGGTQLTEPTQLRPRPPCFSLSADLSSFLPLNRMMI